MKLILHALVGEWGNREFVKPRLRHPIKRTCHFVLIGHGHHFRQPWGQYIKAKECVCVHSSQSESICPSSNWASTSTMSRTFYSGFWQSQQELWGAIPVYLENKPQQKSQLISAKSLTNQHTTLPLQYDVRHSTYVNSTKKLFKFQVQKYIWQCKKRHSDTHRSIYRYRNSVTSHYQLVI